MNTNSFAQQGAGISPALLSAFQNSHQQQQKPFTGSLNPSQLVNGAGPIQQLGGSINPAALQQQQQQQQQQASHNLSQLLNLFGLSRDQFQALSHQERQNLGQKYIQLLNNQQNQAQQLVLQQVGQQVPYERPLSSASNQGPHQNSMLPPPPPRPSTAQGAAQISRPGTSLSHRSPTIPGSGPTSLGPMMERPAQSDSLFKQGQNQSSQPLSHQSPFTASSSLNPQSGVGPAGMPNMGMGGINNMNMMMNNMVGSMGVPSSPRIGSSIASGAMGPPGLPRSASGDGMSMNMNMGAGSGMNMMGGMNMNMNLANMGGNLGGMNMGMNGPTPRPQSSMGISGGLGGIVPSAGMGSGMGLSGGLGHSVSSMGMNMMMGMNIDSPSRPATASQGQSLGAAPQTPIRQGSLPPQTPTPQQQQSHPGMGSIGMSTMGGVQSIRQNVMASASSNVTGGPAGQGPPGRRQSVPPSSNSGSGINASAGGTPNIAPTPSSPMPITDIVAGGTGMGTLAQHLPSQPSLTGVPNTTSVSTSTLAVGSSGITNPASSSSPASVSAPASSPSATASGPTSTSSMNSSSHLPPLNPLTTHITNLPLQDSEQHILSLSPPEIENVKKWMDVDRDYDRRMRAMKGQMNEELRDLFRPSLGPPGLSFGQLPDKWLSTAAPNWWERGGRGSTGSNWSRFRRSGREMFDVRYSGKRDAAHRAGYKSSRKGRREGFKLPWKIDAEEANRSEILVPIRIEFDVDHHKMREAFIWNLNDPVVTPEMFAQSLVDDYHLSSNYHNLIARSIQEQLADFHGQSFSPIDDGPSGFHSHNEVHEEKRVALNGALDESEARWWARWRRNVKREARKAVEEADALKRGGRRRKAGVNKREGTKQNGGLRKRRKTATTQVKKEDNDADMLADNEMDDEWESDTVKSSDDDDDEWKPLSLEDIKVDEQNMHEDMRILIKLDIIVASIKLDDQFEWDLDNPMASPEEFAEVYAQELGLGGEFKTAIAHSIREQVHAFQKSLLLIGQPSDGAAVDDELKQSLLPGLTSGARPVGDVSMFTPLLNYLSDGEVERTEKEKDKELNKRRKRNTRGRRGIVLPDREPVRTYRTPAIGFPELDANTLAMQAAANAPTSKRAAAAAASLTIASIVTSENRDDNAPFMPQPFPVPTARLPVPSAPLVSSSHLHQQHQQKKEKGKGFFKAPNFPPSVLRPRAHVAAPTESTAADSSFLPPGSNVDKDGQDGHLLAQDTRFRGQISVKKAKELEKEAKEKEFMDGQHSNYIDGVWHCSNCGCPESIAVGRRKGPLGDKSQCGTCGKFWHRHRRPRPVEYNPDPSFHSGLKQKEVETLKTPASKKRGAAALRATTAAAATPSSLAGVADTSEPQTPSGRQNGESHKDRDNDDDRAISPVSTVSSESEAPLAHKVKVNGNHQKALTPPPNAALKSETAKSVTGNLSSTNMEGKSASISAPASAITPSPVKTYPPQWLTTQMHLMQTKYPNDRFEVILRKVNASSTPEWRIKCLDCPGKLYTPGPLETLSNYEVHLKNRQHRQRVNDRLTNASAAAVGAPSGPTELLTL